jgi:alkaline phosphatase D
MEITRRSFLLTTAAASAAPFVRLDAQAPGAGRRVFRHGVASGDPATDRVILWTRVTAPAQTVPEVSWELSRNPTFTRVVARGMTRTGASRDFTVKIDAGGLAPATTYYYRFRTRGEQSPVGRTRTLPDAGARRVRLAVASCSNLPHGYFNVYRLIADRTDLDAVLHLGDYIYEYPNGRYGDGTAFGRIPSPDREIVALADYRTRHAQYKLDPDLQEVHRQHPFIVVWDDHEISNNAWRDGAENHNTDQGEGDYTARRAAAVQSYFEWMPIREDRSTRQPRIYRSFPFGDLADLMMLDTRLVDRDEQADRRETIAVLDDPKRSLLGPAQEAWLVAELGASKRANVTWQLLGQQVMFAPCSLPGASAISTDTWDGYRPGRQRLIDAITEQQLANVIVLTGDVHSSWGYDIAQNPWDGYDPATGRGTLAVELVTPAVSSPSGFANEGGAERMEAVRRARPHLKYLEGIRRGYIVLDVTRERAQADWYYVPTVTLRTRVEEFGKGLVTEAGRPHLVEAASPAPVRTDAGEPAPA